MLEVNNNNSNARSNDSQDSENRGCHDNNEASVEEGVAQAETTDDEYHVEPRQLNLQRWP